MSRPNGPYQGGPPQYLQSQIPLNQSQGRGRGIPVQNQSNFQQSGTLHQSINAGQPSYIAQPNQFNQSGLHLSQQFQNQQQFSQLTQTVNPGQPGYLQTGR